MMPTTTPCAVIFCAHARKGKKSPFIMGRTLRPTVGSVVTLGNSCFTIIRFTLRSPLLCLTKNAPTPGLPKRHAPWIRPCCFDLMIDLTVDSNALYQTGPICLYSLVDWPRTSPWPSTYSVAERLHHGRAPTPWPSASVAERLGSGTDQHARASLARAKTPKSS